MTSSSPGSRDGFVVHLTQDEVMEKNEPQLRKCPIRLSCRQDYGTFSESVTDVGGTVHNQIVHVLALYNFLGFPHSTSPLQLHIDYPCVGKRLAAVVAALPVYRLTILVVTVGEDVA
ncbi:hypothetical protein STEG23_029058 [Scotinomys teguina]